MATCCPARNSRKAFSLIEVVVSIFITALTLTLLLQILPVAYHYRKKGDGLLQQALQAQNILERTLVMDSAQWAHQGNVSEYAYQVDVVPEANFPQVRRLIVRVSLGPLPPLSNEPEATPTPPEIYRLETLALP